MKLSAILTVAVPQGCSWVTWAPLALGIEGTPGILLPAHVCVLMRRIPWGLKQALFLS